jgi:splicing factor 3A subunit 3
LKLHKKILNENYKNTFKPDYEEEFEDDQGNVLSRKVYIDLKRQGII